jgi:hypothetical protein
MSWLFKNEYLPTARRPRKPNSSHSAGGAFVAFVDQIENTVRGMGANFFPQIAANLAWFVIRDYL